MRAEPDQAIAIEGGQRGAGIGRETGLGHGRLAVGHEALAVGRLGLQAKEGAVQPLGLRRRKEVMGIHRIAHLTIAFPWCHDGS